MYGCGEQEAGVVVRRYIDFLILYTYPYSSCICSFLQQHPYFLFIFKNVVHSWPNSDFFTSCGAYVNLRYIAML